MTNLELREKAASAGVKQWQIAEKIGIREEALSRKFRHELPDEEKAKIEKAITEISSSNH